MIQMCIFAARENNSIKNDCITKFIKITVGHYARHRVVFPQVSNDRPFFVYY